MPTRSGVPWTMWLWVAPRSPLLHAHQAAIRPSSLGGSPRQIMVDLLLYASAFHYPSMAKLLPLREPTSKINLEAFLQVRTRNYSPALNLEGSNALRLRVKGDGLRYKLTVRTDYNWDGVGYTQYLPPSHPRPFLDPNW